MKKLECIRLEVQSPPISKVYWYISFMINDIIIRNGRGTPRRVLEPKIIR